MDYLYDRLLDAEPNEVAVIVQQLSGHNSELTERLWAVMEHPDKEHQNRRLKGGGGPGGLRPGESNTGTKPPAGR